MEYLLHIFVIACIYTILSLSLNLLVGYTGIPALGHAAFYCVGAYTSSLVVLHYHASPWIGLMCGACVAAVLGAVVSFPFLRLRGDYLALATFGLAIIIYSVSRNWVSVTNGPMGVSGIPEFSLLGSRLSGAKTFAVLAASFVALTCFVISRVTNSPFGRALRGIREDEMAALAMGKNVSSYKITVFAVGALFAGIAGSLYAHYITFIDPSSFTPMESIVILLMVVFGGAGSIAGSLLGASILVVFPEVLRFLEMPSFLAAPLRQMIYGLLLIVLMLKRPQGVWGKYKFR